RAHAYELAGDVEIATSQLVRVMTADLRANQLSTMPHLLPLPSSLETCDEALNRVIAEAGLPFALCPQAYPAARAEVSRRAARNDPPRPDLPRPRLAPPDY